MGMKSSVRTNDIVLFGFVWLYKERTGRYVTLRNEWESNESTC